MTILSVAVLNDKFFSSEKEGRKRLANQNLQQSSFDEQLEETLERLFLKACVVAVVGVKPMTPRPKPRERPSKYVEIVTSVSRATAMPRSTAL